MNNEQNEDDNQSVRKIVREIFDDTDANESEKEITIESCNFCGEVFEDIADLINHFADTGHNLEDE